MGIYNRDYLRGDRPAGFSSPADDWALKFLLAANIGVFLLQNLSRDLTEHLSLSVFYLRDLQLWRLLTYGFLHGSLSHIFWNMFALWIFGKYVEPIYGSREFLAFYLVGVLISGLCHVLFEVITGDLGLAMGASGGVMAVVFLTAMVYPRQQVLLMFVIPIELRWLAVLYAVVDVMGMAQPGSGVAHAAHLGGAAWGVAYRYFHWRVLTFRLPRVRFRRRPKLKVFAPEPRLDDLDTEVDRILAKIHDHGESSLTDREREILKAASQKYKNRT